MTVRSSFFAILVFVTACAPGGPESTAPSVADVLPGDGSADGSADDGPVDDTAVDPLNLSFEWPRLDVGEQLHPDAWDIDEIGDARGFAVRADEDAAEGNQFLVLEIDGDGETWAISPPLAVLEQGTVQYLTFALRSDCAGGVLSLRAGASSTGFAVLPMSSSWADLSFAVDPTASQSGQEFSVELINESATPCALEVDHFRLD